MQRAPFNYNSKNNGPALIREAQDEVARQVPHTGLVVTNDIGDADNIHPAQKLEVGVRLGNLALGDAYGRDTISYESPRFESMEVKGNKALVRFSQPIRCEAKSIRGFRIVDESGNIHPAEARLRDGQAVEVWAKSVKRPVAVRYCFDDATVGNLQGTNALPVAPFRTDK